MSVENTEIIEIIPGRAAILKIPLNNDKVLQILNIYAPNDPTNSGYFWKQITNEIENKHIPNPDVTLGDFNTVEDSIDQLPNKTDNYGTVQALRNMRTNMDLIDGWRTTYPNKKKLHTLRKGPRLILETRPHLYNKKIP